jgi:hypothetical protein
VGFVVDNVDIGTGFSPSISVYPCQQHFTNPPLPSLSYYRPYIRTLADEALEVAKQWRL